VALDVSDEVSPWFRFRRSEVSQLGREERNGLGSNVALACVGVQPDAVPIHPVNWLAVA